MFKKTHRQLRISGVTVFLPPIPKDRLTIRNSHLPKHKQKWEKTELPDIAVRNIEIVSGEGYRADELIDWEAARREEVIHQTGRDPWVVDRKGEPIRVPDIIPNPTFVFEEMEDFRKQELARCHPITGGVWCMINGRAIWITPFHYFYLCWWKLNTGYPEWRWLDAQAFYHWQWVYENPDALGQTEAACRGSGKTVRSTSKLYLMSIYKKNGHFGIQSKTDEDAEQVFQQTLIEPYKDLPDFLIPINSNPTDPRRELRWFAPTKTGRSASAMRILQRQALRTKITYRNAKESAYDGATLAGLLRDEEGKCLGINELCIMYNGTKKYSQDIEVGDLLMGINSKPRKVLKLFRGKGQMYQIEPNKGKSFSCNDNHILSLVCCSNRSKKYYKDSIHNIAVKDFIKLPSSVQKHLQLYRAGVEYKEQHHEIDPYLLGLWLGDGSSCAPSITVADTDIEIKDYIRTYNSTLLKDKRDTACETFYIKDIVGEFRDEKLLKNKHIPNSYLVDSRKNRLNLLAGLLDSDGYKVPNKGGYEIIQKRKELAMQIAELAKSLGFYSSLNMKYSESQWGNKGFYARVKIHGDELADIPCKVERKKVYEKEKHKNTRSSSRSGFKVIDAGIDNFYGFEIDGEDKLFLLGDYTVTHNSDTVNVNQRHAITSSCVYRDGKVVGKIISTTTVEEWEKGGESFKKMWDDSDPSDLGELGITKSRLYKLMFPAYQTEYQDEYGFPDEVKAKRIQSSRRKDLRNNPEALQKYILQYPWNESEMFTANGTNCQFNLNILRERERICNAPHYDGVRIGDFIWSTGIGNPVEFVDNPDNGKWHVSLLLDKNKSNNIRRVWRDGGDKIIPSNDHVFSAGFDPTKVRSSEKKSRSRAAGCIIGKEDFWGECDFPDVIADYVWLPDDPDEAYLDFLAGCYYYGIPFLPETNLGIPSLFERYNMENFLMIRPEVTRAASSVAKFQEIGMPSSEMSNDLMMRRSKTWMHHNAFKLKHPRVVRDLISYDPTNRGIYDLGVAFQLAVIAADKYAPKEAIATDLGELFGGWANIQ